MKNGSSSLKEEIAKTKLERNVRSVHQDEKQPCCKPNLYLSYNKGGIKRVLSKATNKTAKNIGGYNLKMKIFVSKIIFLKIYLN